MGLKLFPYPEEAHLAQGVDLPISGDAVYIVKGFSGRRLRKRLTIPVQQPPGAGIQHHVRTGIIITPWYVYQVYILGSPV